MMIFQFPSVLLTHYLLRKQTQKRNFKLHNFKAFVNLHNFSKNFGEIFIIKNSKYFSSYYCLLKIPLIMCLAIKHG